MVTIRNVGDAPLELGRLRLVSGDTSFTVERPTRTRLEGQQEAGQEGLPHHQLGAVFEAQHHGDQAREHEAHEEGEAQQHRHASGRILGFFDREHEAKGACQEDHQAQAATQRGGDAGGHA